MQTKIHIYKNFQIKPFQNTVAKKIFLSYKLLKSGIKKRKKIVIFNIHYVDPCRANELEIAYSFQKKRCQRTGITCPPSPVLISASPALPKTPLSRDIFPVAPCPGGKSKK